ncbi:MAG: hypothetical protein CR957_00200 [Gammaproteobacteria bacterium]|nr:MAG: hypothetical protein CR957_00200 [Gammaproteobacteria bacterium]
MITLQNYRNEAFVGFCNEKLKEYTQNYRGIETALLATPDGFEIAVYSHKETQADKLAAVGSSLFALGSSLVAEFNLKDCKSIILDSERGKVYISSIANGNNAVVLMVQSSDQATLGNIIHGAKRLNDDIAGKLNSIG